MPAAALTPIYTLAADQPGRSDALKTLLTDAAADFIELQAVAELWLGLTAPPYAEDKGAPALRAHIVRQMNFMLEQGLAPARLKSSNLSHPGVSTQYRDRIVDPGALAGCQRVTGARTIDFTPFGVGT